MLIILGNRSFDGCLIECELLKFKCDVVRCGAARCGINSYKSQLEKGIKKICLMKLDLWSDKIFANGWVKLRSRLGQVEPVKMPLIKVFDYHVSHEC